MQENMFMECLILSGKKNIKSKIMKINAIRTLILASLAIIILYTLGLFLPIITNTKDSKIQNLFPKRVVFILKKYYFSLSLGNNSTKLQGL